MRSVLVAAVGAAVILGSPAVAQGGDAPADVNGYLCTFAGKCGDTAAATPTKAAPATKGFRLAAVQTPVVTPTVAAPRTKGFHLAAAGQATAPVEPAPATKGFHLAQAVAPAPVVKQAPVRRIAAVHRAPTGQARADLSLAFELNSARMTPAAEVKARIFAAALMNEALRDRRFLIEGHTDARGSRDANIDLSRRRAQSVADFLVAQGVAKGRVEVRGVGPDQPLAGRPADAEANRRVEAVMLS